MQILILLVAGALSSQSAMAKNFSDLCPNLKSCVKAVSEMTGDKYMNLPNELECKVETTQNFDVDKKNVTLHFTNMLHLCGLTRVMTGESNSYTIKRENDAKGGALPDYKGSFDQAPPIPENWDIVRMEYKMTHPESVKQLENLVRTYTNMGARIYGYEGDGTLVIASSGMELINLYPFIKSKDVKVDSAVLNGWKENRVRRPMPDPKSKKGNL